MWLGIDPTYYLIMLPALIASGWASWKIHSTFSRYQQVPSRRGLTGAEIAHRLLTENGAEDVQIEAVQGADLIAGPTGAAWTNLLFVEPGTRCLCWMAEEQREFAAYSNLAHAVGAELRYLTYATGVSDSERLYFMNYRLDPAAVERALKDLG